MSTRGRWVLILALLFLILVVPFVYFRYQYTDGKRLRVVVPGKFYRSGQMSADGFTAAILRFQIRTVVNVQDDVLDVAGIWIACGMERGQGREQGMV